MKFSVLLPTRNRLELLRYAIESVRRQDYDDWEIILSDNDSAEDVGAYVSGLHDSRIRYFRTPRFLPVTENWNSALAQSAGDYVVMLGDDDCLLPGYFRKLAALIGQYSSPDAVYVEGVQYAYPGVIPGHAKGFVQIGYCQFMKGRTQSFLLSKEEARAAVGRSMKLRYSFGYNMQHSLVSRRRIDALAQYGPFFQSPYPDYYASNALLLTAERVVVVPEPLVAIGISPKSFGYYYFNAREGEGTAFLNNLGESSVPAFARDWILPGSALFTCWYVAMACIEHNFGREHGIRADVGRYRCLQVVSFDRKARGSELRHLWSRLTPRERLQCGSMRRGIDLVARLLPPRAAARFVQIVLNRIGPFPKFDPRKREVDQRNILELFDDWPRLQRVWAAAPL